MSRLRRHSFFIGAGLLAFLPAVDIFLRNCAASNREPCLFLDLGLALLLDPHHVGHLLGAHVLLQVPFSELGDPLLLTATFVSL